MALLVTCTSLISAGTYQCEWIMKFRGGTFKVPLTPPWRRLNDKAPLEVSRFLSWLKGVAHLLMLRIKCGISNLIWRSFIYLQYVSLNVMYFSSNYTASLLSRIWLGWTMGRALKEPT